jgi:hypothetical protein
MDRKACSGCTQPTRRAGGAGKQKNAGRSAVGTPSGRRLCTHVVVVAVLEVLLIEVEVLSSLDRRLLRRVVHGRGCRQRCHRDLCLC